LARIGAVLKRVTRARDAHQLTYGDLTVNILSREVTVGGMRVDLSAKEFALLATLAGDPERVFTKRELLQMVWDFRSPGKTRTLDSHASRLRQKDREALRRGLDRERVGRRLPTLPADMIRDAIRRRRDGGRDAIVASMEDLAGRLAYEERARAAFIGKVSHELRTPLTVIKGYVYTLQRGEGDLARAAKLHVIDAECERLSYMIESLLELSRVRAGHVRVCETPFALRPCVEEVAERLEAVANHRGTAIRVAWSCPDAVVSGDENRVRQVFANLIGNRSRSVAR
jgi:signal transduction histidine kinase